MPDGTPSHTPGMSDALRANPVDCVWSCRARVIHANHPRDSLADLLIPGVWWACLPIAVERLAADRPR